MPVVLPLVALDVLVIALWCIAVALAIALVMDKLSTILAGVPWIGGKLSDAVRAMAQAITNAAGSLESGIDHLVGAAWHALARYVDTLFSQFVTHSVAIAHLARLVGNSVYSVSGLRDLVHYTQRAVHYLGGQVGTLAREYNGIEHRVKRLEHDIAKGIGSDVLPRIKTLDRRLAHVEHGVIPAIESADTALQNDVTSLGEYIRSNFLSSATDAVTAAVVVALGALGLGGLRCNSLLNSLKNRGCGLWNGLEDLLGLLFDAVVFVDLCAVIPEVEKLFGDFEEPLTALIASAADAVCAQPPAGYPTLPAVKLSLPPSPGFTLHIA